jgi:hypothetical protein
MDAAITFDRTYSCDTGRHVVGLTLVGPLRELELHIRLLDYKIDYKWHYTASKNVPRPSTA